ncbi:hypothetical protein L211DRAFT_237047 [Terfezia boudieri ATCC MYA-4762]|uniref:Uncharacterized protein n=1 Tax=Terfezia boudieri ATCC MYA-4762 TaxID=1051890 RepID=A0A3N4MKG5_9PEZI|nr:hypothetical protein L211DRAFT_237047 [Terfezia boudieri ATCC MYA-4762]
MDKVEMPQTRSQTGIGAAAHQKKASEFDAARATSAPSTQAGDSTTESSASSPYPDSLIRRLCLAVEKS